MMFHTVLLWYLLAPVTENRPWHSLGGYIVAFDRRTSVSISGNFMWHLWWMKWHWNSTSSSFFGLPLCSLFQRYITLTLQPSLSCATDLTRQRIVTSSVCKLETSFLTCHVTREVGEVTDQFKSTAFYYYYMFRHLCANIMNSIRI
jgi:hypothetical protein